MTYVAKIKFISFNPITEDGQTMDVKEFKVDVHSGEKALDNVIVNAAKSYKTENTIVQTIVLSIRADISNSEIVAYDDHFQSIVDKEVNKISDSAMIGNKPKKK